MPRMECHITDGPQEPDDIPGLDYDDDAFELARQEAIDSAIEAGDHLLDQRKEDSLVNALEGITRSLKP